MAITITKQPAQGELMAAYAPMEFWVDCNQAPNGPATSACPVVIADLYFDGQYYQSISATDYDVFIFFVFVFITYKFDIQDKVQEYLNTHLPYMAENLGTTGLVETKTFINHSVQVEVKFRESYVDANGLTQTYGTAPVARTKFTNPVAGTGTATSNTIYAVNANLRHEDNPNFETHLSYFRDQFFQSPFQLSHRPNNIYGLPQQIGGGKYWVDKMDNDYISIFTDVDPTNWFGFATGRYKDGSSFSVQMTQPIPNNPVGITSNIVFMFNAGIPSLRGLLPTVDWDNVEYYEFGIGAPFFQAMRQRYYVRDYCNYYRLFFRNTAGGWDGINLEYPSEDTQTKSGTYKTRKTGGSYVGGIFVEHTPKSDAGLRRLQPTQNEVLTLQCKDYGEQDQKWLKELDATPQAFIQWIGEQGQPNALIPVVVLDTNRQTIKTKNEHDYLLIVKLQRSNDVVSLRM